MTWRSVMVTGAGGFVGRRLVAALRPRLRSDATLIGVQPSRPPGAREIGVDLLDAAALHDAVRQVRPDLVIHLAAQSSVGQALGAAAATWRTNMVGTLNLAEAIASEAPGATVVFASSAEVYGASFNDGPATEATLPRPQSTYARSKRCGEELLADVLSPDNRLLVLRPTNHSGAGQDARFVLPAFAGQVAAIEAGRQEPVLRVGDLSARRDFLDVRDVIDAYLQLIDRRSDARRETFNIASGHVTPIADLLDLVLAETGAAITVEPDPARMRASEVPVAAVDPTKLRAAVSWSPRYELADTVRDVLADQRRLLQTNAN